MWIWLRERPTHPGVKASVHVPRCLQKDGNGRFTVGRRVLGPPGHDVPEYFTREGMRETWLSAGISLVPALPCVIIPPDARSWPTSGLMEAPYRLSVVGILWIGVAAVVRGNHF